MEQWEKLSKPPLSALKRIGAGRLTGKSDINPQWRYKVMTEVYGQCGEGWRFKIDRLWTEPASDGQIFAFAMVSVETYSDIMEKWSDSIPGVGGSMLIANERNGLHSNDEAFKMAVTDALGTALKMLGVAADIYLGNFDGTKYRDQPPAQSQPEYQSNEPMKPTAKMMARFWAIAKNSGLPDEEIQDYIESVTGFRSSSSITSEQYENICNWIEATGRKRREQ